MRRRRKCLRCAWARGLVELVAAADRNGRAAAPFANVFPAVCMCSPPPPPPLLPCSLTPTCPFPLPPLHSPSFLSPPFLFPQQVPPSLPATLSVSHTSACIVSPCTHASFLLPHCAQSVTYVYDDVTYVYDDVTYAKPSTALRASHDASTHACNLPGPVFVGALDARA